MGLLRAIWLELPYVGRQFGTYGVVDCYSLVRDWYAGHGGLQLRDYDRHMTSGGSMAKTCI